MNLIYIHISSFDHLIDSLPNYTSDKYVSIGMPEYLFDSIIHTRKTYNGNIYVIGNSNDIAINSDFFNRFACITYSVEDLIHSPYILNFFKCITSKFNNINSKFLVVTFLRLFLLSELINRLDLEDTFHIENDNLLYFPLDELKITDMNHIQYCIVGDTCDSAGIMFCRNKEYINKLMIDILDFINLGYNECSKLINSVHISEMEILYYIRSKSAYISSFNSLPVTNDKILYDGASYGQYLGGSNNGHLPGITFRHHIIGRFLNMYINDLRFIFKNNRCILNFKNNEYLLVNLHVHNKSMIKKFLYV